MMIIHSQNKSENVAFQLYKHNHFHVNSQFNFFAPKKKSNSRLGNLCGIKIKALNNGRPQCNSCTLQNDQIS